MRLKNKELKKSIYDFVNDWKRECGKSPSLKVIANNFGVNKSTIYRYLLEMDEDGEIVYDGTRIDAKELNQDNTRLAGAMIVGSIPCGEATSEEEHVEEYVNLPEALFGSGEFYILRTRDDSMEDAGIFEKELVIKKQPTANAGDIVVALAGDNENTLKRFGGFDEKGYAILEYMNEDAYPDKIIRVKQLTVQGVARHVIKSL